MQEAQKIIPVPELARDKQRPPDDGVMARCMIERAVVFALLLHMERAGFTAISVCGGDEDTPTKSHVEVMDEVFSMDDARIYFKKGNADSGSALIILGNDGFDAISDWSYLKGDTDGFSAAMDAFDPEKAVVMGVIGVTNG